MSMSAVTMSEEQQIYTVNDVARLLRVHPRTVRNMIRDGELEAFMVRSEYRITQSALDAVRMRDTGRQKAIRKDGERGRGNMRAGQIIISVWNCRSAVSRYEANQGGLSVVEAENWQDLEDKATEEVESQGGAVNLSGHYTCSDLLAQMAHWQEG